LGGGALINSYFITERRGTDGLPRSLSDILNGRSLKGVGNEMTTF
jgi:hypothetical protein